VQKEQKKVQEAENKKWKDEESDKKMAAQVHTHPYLEIERRKKGKRARQKTIT